MVVRMTNEIDATKPLGRNGAMKALLSKPSATTPLTFKTLFSLICFKLSGMIIKRNLFN